MVLWLASMINSSRGQQVIEPACAVLRTIEIVDAKGQGRVGCSRNVLDSLFGCGYKMLRVNCVCDSRSLQTSAPSGALARPPVQGWERDT